MDTEYVLTSAFELGQLTPVECAALSVGTGYDKVRKVVDADEAFTPHFLENTSRQELSAMSVEDRYVCALKAVSGLPLGVKALKERLEHRVRMRVQEDLGMREAFLLRREGEELPLVANASEVNETAVCTYLGREFEWLRERWKEDLVLMDRALQWLSCGGREYLVESSASRTDAQSKMAVFASRFDVRVQSRQSEALKLVRKAKSAIKKATKLFERIGKEDALAVLVSGGEVVLAREGSAFELRLRPVKQAGWLIDRTQKGKSHTPYELSLHRCGGGFLANLCVYFKDMPVLDQMLALMLHVESGEELRILEGANWFGMEDLTAEDRLYVESVAPALVAKLPKLRAEGEVVVVSGFAGVSERMRREEALWEPYKGRVEQWVRTWLEAVMDGSDRLVAGSRETVALLEDLQTEKRVCALKDVRALLPARGALPVADDVCLTVGVEIAA